MFPFPEGGRPFRQSQAPPDASRALVKDQAPGVMRTRAFLIISKTGTSVFKQEAKGPNPCLLQEGRFRRDHSKALHGFSLGQVQPAEGYTATLL